MVLDRNTPKYLYNISWIMIRITELEFNKLGNKERLIWLFDNFEIGMSIIAKVNDRDPVYGKIIGFLNSSTYSPSTNPKNKVGESKSLHTKLPKFGNEFKDICNIYILDDSGNYTNYYPLWIRPDLVSIRSKKLDILGI